MDAKEIQKRLDDLVLKMTERVMVTPSAKAMFEDGKPPFVLLSWNEGGASGYKSIVGKKENIHEAFELASAELSAIPPKADRDRAEFTRLLAQVIDKGNDIGIEVDMLNPLQAMMQKLSENAITYQVRPVTPPAPYGFDPNDPMPF